MAAGLLVILHLLTTGCQQKMAQQPRLAPLGAESFFPDGRASRPLEFGTVSREPLEPALGNGRHGDGHDRHRAVSSLAGVGAGPLAAIGALTMATDPVSGYDDAFPFPVTQSMLERGRERFNIFCAPCHNQTGNGQGMVVLRGFFPPPNFHTDVSRGLRFRGATVPLRDVPPGYIVNVITRGYGAMADYSSQVPLRDRWAITAYVKALQLSQHAPLSLLDARDREALEKEPASRSGEGSR
jgi:hypothetical protein